MEDINLHQKAIEQLTLEGHVILQVINDKGQILYFSVYKWQESYFNTAQSVDFNTVEGINVTDFLFKNSALYMNRINFISLFNKTIEEGVLVRCEFSKNWYWNKWSAPRSIK